MIVRDDDKEHIIEERHRLYMEKTLPILDYYRKRNLVIDIEAKNGVDDFAMMRDVVINHTKHF